MKTSPELLKDILGVLGKIDTKLENVQQSIKSAGAVDVETADAKRKTKGLGLDLDKFATDKKTTGQIKDTAESLKILSASLPELTKSISAFAAVPKTLKQSIVNFIHDLLSQSVFKDIKSTDAAKTAAEAIAIIVNSLSELSLGIIKFGKVSDKSKTSLIGFIKDLFSLSVFKNLKTTQTAEIISNALAIIGSSLINLSGGIIKFSLVPDKSKITTLNFINDLLSLSVFKNMSSTLAAKTTAEAIEIIGNSLSKLTNGITIIDSIPNKAKVSFIDFIQNLFSLSIFDKASSITAAKQLESSLLIVGDSLPTFAKKLVEFELTTKNIKKTTTDFIKELFSLSLFKDKNIIEVAKKISSAFDELGNVLFQLTEKLSSFSSISPDIYKSAKTTIDFIESLFTLSIFKNIKLNDAKQLNKSLFIISDSLLLFAKNLTQIDLVPEAVFNSAKTVVGFIQDLFSLSLFKNEKLGVTPKNLSKELNIITDTLLQFTERIAKFDILPAITYKAVKTTANFIEDLFSMSMFNTNKSIDNIKQTDKSLFAILNILTSFTGKISKIGSIPEGIYASAKTILNFIQDIFSLSLFDKFKSVDIIKQLDKSLSVIIDSISVFTNKLIKLNIIPENVYKSAKTTVDFIQDLFSLSMFDKTTSINTIKQLDKSLSTIVDSLISFTGKLPKIGNISDNIYASAKTTLNFIEDIFSLSLFDKFKSADIIKQLDKSLSIVGDLLLTFTGKLMKLNAIPEYTYASAKTTVDFIQDLFSLSLFNNIKSINTLKEFEKSLLIIIDSLLTFTGKLAKIGSVPENIYSSAKTALNFMQDIFSLSLFDKFKSPNLLKELDKSLYIIVNSLLSFTEKLPKIGAIPENVYRSAKTTVDFIQDLFSLSIFNNIKSLDNIKQLEKSLSIIGYTLSAFTEKLGKFKIIPEPVYRSAKTTVDFIQDLFSLSLFDNIKSFDDVKDLDKNLSIIVNMLSAFTEKLGKFKVIPDAIYKSAKSTAAFVQDLFSLSIFKDVKSLGSVKDLDKNLSIIVNMLSTFTGKLLKIGVVPENIYTSATSTINFIESLFSSLFNNLKSVDSAKQLEKSLSIIGNSLISFSGQTAKFEAISKSGKSIKQFIQNILSVFQDTKTIDNAKNLSETLKVIGDSFPSLLQTIKKFELISDKSKESLKNFIQDFFSLSIFKDVKFAEVVKATGESVAIIGNYLSEFFGKISTFSVSDKSKKQISDFINEFFSLSIFKDTKLIETAKTTLESMNVVGDSLSGFFTKINSVEIIADKSKKISEFIKELFSLSSFTKNKSTEIANEIDKSLIIIGTSITKLIDVISGIKSVPTEMIQSITVMGSSLSEFFTKLSSFDSISDKTKKSLNSFIQDLFSLPIFKDTKFIETTKTTVESINEVGDSLSKFFTKISEFNIAAEKPKQISEFIKELFNLSSGKLKSADAAKELEKTLAIIGDSVSKLVNQISGVDSIPEETVKSITNFAKSLTELSTIKDVDITDATKQLSINLSTIIKTLNKFSTELKDFDVTKDLKKLSLIGKSLKALNANVESISVDKKTTTSLTDTSEAIKNLSSVLGPLSGGLLKFGLIPKGFKTSLITFVKDLLSLSEHKGKDAGKAARTAAEGMGIIAGALPNLGAGLIKFGLIPKMFKTLLISFIKELLSLSTYKGKKSNEAAKIAAESMGIIVNVLPNLAGGVLKFGLIPKVFKTSLISFIRELISLSEYKGKKSSDASKIAAESMGIIATALPKLSSGLIKFGLIPGAFKTSLLSFIKKLYDLSKHEGKIATLTAKIVAESMGIIADALPKLSKGLIFFGVIPTAFKNSIIDFMDRLAKLSKLSPEVMITAGLLVALGEALPKLAKGVLRFGIVSSTGLLTATTVGLTALLGVVGAAGVAAPVLLAGATVIAAVGVAFIGIGKVLSGIAKVMLAFAGSIAILVTTIYVASAIFKVEPRQVMGTIVGSLAILAGGFAMIGMLAVPIALGSAAIAMMGVGIGIVAIGLLAMIGSYTLMNIMTGSPEKTRQALLISMGAIGLMGLLFAGLGIISIPLFLGALVAKPMAKGILWLTGGLLALGSTYALLDKVFKIDVGKMLLTTAKGIALLGLTLAALGLAAIPIAKGALVLIAMSFSLGAFALVSMGIGAIINKMGGKDGVNTMTENISLLLSGVLQGIISGISIGVLGEKGDRPEGFFGKVGKVIKNVDILIASIGLLGGVSLALILFATSLKAFTKAGVVKTITGHDAKGNPIFGPEIDVVSAGTNIAKSIGSFFTTLIETFKNPEIIPSAVKMAAVSQLLMGNAGPKLLGIKLHSSGTPGIIDALTKFTELITVYSKINQLPIYEIVDGEAKITEYVTPAYIAGTIAGTVSSFFSSLIETFGEKNTVMPSAAKMAVISQLLMGNAGPKLLGIRVYSTGTPGIIDALTKFAEMLTIFSKVNQIPVYAVDDKGNIKVSGYVDPGTVATNIATTISSFFTGLSGIRSKLTSMDDIWVITQALLGVKGPRFLGMRTTKTVEYPGLIDALTKFADLLSIFNKADHLPVYNIEDGKPVVKSYISTVDIAKNISNSVSKFFTGLTSIALPSNSEITNITHALLGTKISRRLIRKGVPDDPGLVDALSQFADLLSTFSKATVIPVYDINAEGKTKIKQYVEPEKIALNITSAISKFFQGLKGIKIPSNYEIINITHALLGTEISRRLIRKGVPDDPGLVDALSQFAKMISMYGKINQMPVYEVDDKGKPKIISYTDPATIATTIANSISGFFRELTTKIYTPDTENVERIAQSLLGSKISQRLVRKGKLNDKPGIIDALSKFADLLTKFSKIQSIPIFEGVDANGNTKVAGYASPIGAATKIVTALSSFFTTLTTLFKNTAVIPSDKKIGEISQILLGTSARKFLGIRIAEKPGIIDALTKFANLLSLFAEKDKIPVYDVDEKGKIKKGTSISPKTVAEHIVKALSLFFTEFKNQQSTLETLSNDTTVNIAQLLLGQQAPRLFGKFKLPWKQDKPGLIEPILKFAEVLGQYADITSAGFPVTDENGKITHKPIDKIVKGLTNGISMFMTEINKAFSVDLASGGETDKAKRKTIDQNLKSFDDVISKLNSFSTNLSGVDKLSKSLGDLATNLGLLVSNMGALDVKNLEKLVNSGAFKNMPSSGGPAGGYNSLDANLVKLSAATTQLATAAEAFTKLNAGKPDEQLAPITGLPQGTFQFRFFGTDNGTITFGK
jgi:hypothetical protein